ncbi:MAG: hypothetical protein ABFC57_15695 [Veillonellales bacterium]
MRKITLAELRLLSEQARPRLEEIAGRIGRPVKIYIHWTTGPYNLLSPDYHVNVGQDGTLFVSTDDLNEYKLHTRHRNGGAVAVCAACGKGAWGENLGSDPPTNEQIETIAQAVAVLADALAVPIDAEHVMTHAEAADNLDRCVSRNKLYGPRSAGTCWDFWLTKPGDDPGSGGDTLRGKALWYQHHSSGGSCPEVEVYS